MYPCVESYIQKKNIWNVFLRFFFSCCLLCMYSVYGIKLTMITKSPRIHRSPRKKKPPLTWGIGGAVGGGSSYCNEDKKIKGANHLDFKRRERKKKKKKRRKERQPNHHPRTPPNLCLNALTLIPFRPTSVGYEKRRQTTTPQTHLRA